jgi:heme/copper-type cytochrome/quinol oxidase subunit 3
MYILYRAHHGEIYEYAHHYLSVKWGAVNTAVLILSSLSAAWAVRCAQMNQRRGLIFCIVVTILCAFGFLGVKTIEYSKKIRLGELYGEKFDPCFTPNETPLLTKSKKCPGHISSVVWDPRGKAVKSGCLDAGEYDRDPTKPGIQAQCTVDEVTYQRVLVEQLSWVDADGKVVSPTRDEKVSAKDATTIFVDDKGKEVAASASGAKKLTSKMEKVPQRKEVSRRPLEACEIEIEAATGEPVAKNPPCYKLQVNHNVCPKGPGVLALYGDEEVRGNELGDVGDKLGIDARCNVAPAVKPPPDVLADRTQPIQLGVSTEHAPHVRTDKEEVEELESRPPPPHTNMFFSIYFAMTGLHGLHVLFGIFVFIWLLYRSIRGHFSDEYFGPVDYAALYWHLVDLIWIFLFPLLYLIH